MREAIHKALDAPTTPVEKAVSYSLVGVIVLSIGGLVVQERVSEPSDVLRRALVTLEYLILIVFGLEYLTRVLVTPRPQTYVFSVGGLIDLLALVPSFASLILPTLPNVAWLRVLRLFRFLRVLRISEIAAPQGPILWSGILFRVAPYLCVAMAFKAVTLSFEGKPWWPGFDDLKTLLAVVGFAIGVLLATKLGSAQKRMSEIETAVCQLVGVVAIVRETLADDSTLRRWTGQLESFLARGEEADALAATTFELTVALAAEAPAPYLLALRQQGELLVNRAHAGMAAAYDRFLRNALLVYALAVIMVLPGLAGFLSVALVVYVLGGMYFLIEDMDRPIDHRRVALIDADLTPLRQLNESWSPRN